MSCNDGIPVSQAVLDVFRAFGGGRSRGLGNVLARDVVFFSKQNVGVTGTTKVQFFNEAFKANITNLEKASTLPAGYVMRIKTIFVNWLYGIDREGKRVSTTDSKTVLAYGAYDVAADHNAVQWKALECSRALMQTGRLKMTIGEQPMVDVADLGQFPDGSALIPLAALSQMGSGETAGAPKSTADALMNFSNGSPCIANQRILDPALDLFANDVFSVDIEWPRAIDWTDAEIGPLVGETGSAGTLTVGLRGQLVSPG